MKEKDVEVLRYLNKAANELIVWLFDTNNKRYVIEKALKMVYSASRERTAKEIFKELRKKGYAEYKGATTWYLTDKDFKEVEKRWLK